MAIITIAIIFTILTRKNKGAYNNLNPTKKLYIFRLYNKDLYNKEYNTNKAIYSDAYSRL